MSRQVGAVDPGKRWEVPMSRYHEIKMGGGWEGERGKRERKGVLKHLMSSSTPRILPLLYSRPHMIL